MNKTIKIAKTLRHILGPFQTTIDPSKAITTESNCFE